MEIWILHTLIKESATKQQVVMIASPFNTLSLPVYLKQKKVRKIKSINYSSKTEPLKTNNLKDREVNTWSTKRVLN